MKLRTILLLVGIAFIVVAHFLVHDRDNTPNPKKNSKSDKIPEKEDIVETEIIEEKGDEVIPDDIPDDIKKEIDNETINN